MTSLDSFLETIAEQPHDNDQWLILADFLDDQDDPRGELVRLLHALRQPKANVANRRAKAYRLRRAQEERLRQLVASGVQPCQPRRINNIGMEFVLIPPGVFVMGSPRDEDQRSANETQHRVTLTQGFFLGVHQVTQAQWRTVMGDNPGHFKGDDLPIEQVSWEDCREFCTKLGRSDSQEYRLPTEAEWEYACRAGTTRRFHFGATISTDQVNYDGNYTYGNGAKGKDRQQTTPVGSFPANAWGLYDMHGNVWEWCQDWAGAYPTGDSKDPQGPNSSGEARVVRGGSWITRPDRCRAACRDGNAPAYRRFDVGCRVVLCPD